MKQKTFVNIIKTLSLATFTITFNSCINANATEASTSKRLPSTPTKNRTATGQVKKYWYDGTAEISSYQLKQSRYGELHNGTAVLVYVTEPFSKKSNTKADYSNPANISVLKLNTTKKFNTGIYPYSMMTSTFFPFEKEEHSLKVTSSIQEWCGMTYLEMKNDANFNFNLNSYFEGASFDNKEIEHTILENDLWSLIRLNPNSLPLGKQKIIPSVFYLNATHKEIKPYTAFITIEKGKESIHYKITYPELNREIIINFETKFPNTILGWSETHPSGYGKNKKILTTEAKRITTIKTTYWNKNKNEDKHLRGQLGL